MKLTEFHGQSVLVVDDHRNIRASVRMALESEGAVVDEADGLGQARSKVAMESTFPYSIVLLDIRMPDGSGLDLLRDLEKLGVSSRVIMISGEGTAHEAFQATQLGAFDYIEKPFSPERMLVSVSKCLKFNNLAEANVNLARRLKRDEQILGEHQSIKDMLAVIERVAPTNGRVLIWGESGTGKELVAKGLHSLSERSAKPFVKVNCAAIPHSLIESELFGHEKGAFTGAVKMRRGLFEQANNGTLFLDEIAELPLDVQAKLLRTLQSGEIVRVGGETTVKVDVRLVAATHGDLEEMTRAGEFREDLYYRLNVVQIKVPPLRDRGSDIRLLANAFLEEACKEHSLGERLFSEGALKELEGYSFPGNIRELRNIVERLAILSDQVEIDSVELPRNTAGSGRVQDETMGSAASHGEFSFSCEPTSWQEFHQQCDRAYVKFILKASAGNVSEAARMLCLERAYLHRLMKKLGIQRDIVVE